MQPDNITQACTNMIDQKLRLLPMVQSECTVYRVYGHLRNINNKAYDPEIIATGPYHRGRDTLKFMEDHKLHCFRSLLQRKNQNVDTYVSAIKPLEQEAHKCYADPISLDATEFIEMLILDGCFIIQLVRGKLENPIFGMAWIHFVLARDLMLFENQIPFFVLCQLFNLIKVPNQHGRLICLLTEFYRPTFPTMMTLNSSSHEMKHLVGLIHRNLVSSFDWSVLGKGTNVGERNFVRGATSLREANVKFKKKEGSSMFDISFKHGTLYLPPMLVDDSTECFLRNLIAYEQCFSDTAYVSDYVKVFDCLINSPKDVQILMRAEIIINGLDDEVVADIFNRLTDSIVTGFEGDFVYSEIFDEVNKHFNKRRNRWTAKLRRDYLHSPWAIISIIAAVVLLLLTVAQTVCSILQVV